MASVHFVCVGDDVPRAEALADAFDANGFSLPEAGQPFRDNDVAVLIWSDRSPNSTNFMANARRHLDAGRAVIASCVAIADPSRIGAPTFDLSEWNGDVDDAEILPLMVTVERMMQDELVLETADAAPAATSSFAGFGAAASPPPRAAPPPQAELGTEPEPETLHAVLVEPAPPKPRRAAKPERKPRVKRERVKAAAKPAAPRRRYTPPPRPLRASGAGVRVMGVVAAVCGLALAAAPFVVPLPGGGAREQGAPVQVMAEAPGFAFSAFERVAALPDAPLAQLVELAPAPEITINAVAAATRVTQPRSNRARTPRPITSWETPDPKRRSYLASTGVDAPAPRQATEIAAGGRKSKPEERDI